MRSGSLVQNFWGEVEAAGPGDGANLGVDSHLGEECGIAQGRENAVQFPEMGQFDIADQAVGERQPQPVVAQDLHVGHVIQWNGHDIMLRQRRDGGRRLVRRD